MSPCDRAAAGVYESVRQGAQREFCRAWANQQVVTVPGSHFLQEDSPEEVGQATARFVAKVLAGQMG